MIKSNIVLNILRWGLSDNIEFKDGYVLNHVKWLGINAYTDAFKADRAVFCDEGSGIFGKSIFFGSVDKTVTDNREKIKVDGEDCWNERGFDIFGLKKEDVEAIQQYLIDRGAKLDDNEAVEVKSKFPIFNPFRWFKPREILRFGKEGVFHKVKTFRRSKTSFVPYQDLKVFYATGVFNKKLNILGDVTISTKERFPRSVYKDIDKWLKERCKVLTAEGKTYKPSLLSFKLRNKYIILLDDGFIARDKSKIYYFSYDEIENYGFEKKNWYSLFGTFWCVAYRDDARDYSLTQGWFEDTVHEFEVPGIWRWKWRFLLFFKGSLHKTIKSKCKKAKQEAKKIEREARKQDRELAKEDFKKEWNEAKKELK